MKKHKGMFLPGKIPLLPNEHFYARMPGVVQLLKDEMKPENAPKHGLKACAQFAVAKVLPLVRRLDLLY